MNDYYGMYSEGLWGQEIRADAKFIPKRSMVIKNKIRAARRRRR